MLRVIKCNSSIIYSIFFPDVTQIVLLAPYSIVLLAPCRLLCAVSLLSKSAPCRLLCAVSLSFEVRSIQSISLGSILRRVSQVNLNGTFCNLYCGGTVTEIRAQSANLDV